MNHIVKRGDRYRYVRRVPTDLHEHFPSPTISKSLQTSDRKQARLLATAYEHQAQTLFTNLRTGMLDRATERLVVNLFLKQRIDELDTIATGQAPSKAAAGSVAINEGVIKAREDRQGETLSGDVKRTLQADIALRMAELDRQELATQDPWMYESATRKLANTYRKQYNINIPPSQQKSLALQFVNSDRKANEAAAALYRGEWGLYETLKEKVEAELSKPYGMFSDVITLYQEWYRTSKKHVKPGTMDDMVVECRVLLEIIGNRSISSVNTMETIIKLKGVLEKYPKNKLQRFGDASIHTILGKRKDYEVISAKTANEYLKRLKAIIDFAAKAKLVDSVNVVPGEYFKTDKAAEEERAAYDDDDIKRLVDALCTQPLWRYNPPKPERFWVVLIALFHGLRLGNILKLTKEDICQTDKGTWVFRLRTGKTKATVRAVAICDTLVLLGFLDWVDTLKRNKLFQDTGDSFSKWYNRSDRKPDGSVYTGFEGSYVTTDPKKCLYSLRHTFAGNVFDVTTDYKITADMMGHSTGGSVTARYTKRVKAEALKQISDSMRIDHIDLDALERRAIELFGHM